MSNPIGWKPNDNVHQGYIAFVVPICQDGHIYFGKPHRHACPKCGGALYVQNVGASEYETQKRAYFSLYARLFRFLGLWCGAQIYL